MKIVERQVGDVIVLDLHGKILIGEGDDALRDAVTRLVDSGNTNILLNLADVPYVDLGGPGGDRALLHDRQPPGRPPQAAQPHKKIQDLLAITKLLTVSRPTTPKTKRSAASRATLLPWPCSGPGRRAERVGARLRHDAAPIFVSLRPHQWTKNLMVFAALGFSLAPVRVVPGRATFAFVPLLRPLGRGYLLNDLADLERDRRHPSSGCPPARSRSAARHGGVVARILAFGCLGLAFVLGRPFAATAFVYVG